MLPVVSETYNVTRAELMGRGREYKLAEARFVLWKLLYEELFGYTKISKPFKHGVRRITEVMEYDKKVTNRYKHAKKQLTQRKI
jgi:chromosomal replication initiation ATPase DnaA